MALLSQPGSGANTVSVSTSNATYGNQWDTVTITGAGTTDTYDSAHSVHGYPTAQKIHMAAVSSSNFCVWKASYGGTAANAYAMAYFYMTAFPSVPLRILAFLTGSSAASCAINLTAAGKLTTINSSGGAVATTTSIAPTNAWFRVELQVTGISGTTGTLAGRMFSGTNLEGLTTDTGGSLSTASVAVGGLVNEFRMGASTAVTESSAFDLWVQNIVFSDTAMPAPVGILRPSLRQIQAVNRSVTY